MSTGSPEQDLATLLDRLAERAILNYSAPPVLVERARVATVRALESLGDGPLDGASTRRVTNYFSAVLRRSSARRGFPEAAAYRRRAIAASLIVDLRRAGFDESRISEEVHASVGMTTDELKIAG